MSRAKKPSRRLEYNLPRSLARWEVGFFDIPFVIDGVDTEGMLLIAEESTGHIRAGGPVVRGEGLWMLLQMAFAKPTPPAVPARPAAILCRDSKFAARLREELAGSEIPIQIVASLPRVDAAMEVLRQQFGGGDEGGPQAPGLSRDLPLWAEALKVLCTAEPWTLLPDSIEFRFQSEDPILSKSVAGILGLAGQQAGLILYTSEESYQKFKAQVRAPSREKMAQVECLCLFIDPAKEMEPAEREACKRAGLALSAGRMPRALALRKNEYTTLSAPEERTLLAALQAITRLFLLNLGAQLTRVCESVVPTILGAVKVRSQPPLEDIAFDEEHIVLLGAVQQGSLRRQTVVLKASKRDALKIADQVQSVDKLRMEKAADGRIQMSLWAGDRPVATIFQQAIPPQIEAQITEAHGIMLCVSSGGTLRPTIKPHEFVFTRYVTLESVGAPKVDPGKKKRHDPVFNGPREGWPPLSEALIWMVRETVGEEVEDVSAARRDKALRVASQVWNAVVLADYMDRSEVLEEMRSIAKHDLGIIIERMIAFKRNFHGGDPRLIVDYQEKGKGRDLRLAVSSTFPAGYTL